MVSQAEYDIVFYEAFEEEQELLRKLVPEHLKARFTAQTIQEAKEKGVPAKLISIRTQSKIPYEWNSDLDGILSRSTGYDHLTSYRQKTGGEVALGYLPLYCARAVAEQAMLMTLALLRKFKKQTTSFDSFSRNGLTGGECQDKKLFVVGVGNIGCEVVDIAKGLRMKVAGFDIKEKVASLEYTELKTGLAWADIVVCALPFTKVTDKMLNYDAMKMLKEGALFVNIARGEIAPLADLKRLLDEGILGGIGLDVFEKEKTIAAALRNKIEQDDEAVKIINELKTKENVILTPHNAFNTLEAVEQKAEQTIEAVAMFLTQGKFPNHIPEEQYA
ncbi:MAG: NAD(P)-dependent oxidoreductase [Candidatus Aceula meridiana]|nr:NAD(P)-dependent oxidoreductase [Candidatus Aceula meridiana]